MQPCEAAGYAATAQRWALHRPGLALTARHHRSPSGVRVNASNDRRNKSSEMLLTYFRLQHPTQGGGVKSQRVLSTKDIQWREHDGLFR